MQGKYSRLIHEFVPEAADWGAWSHGPQPYLHGESAIPGANLTAGYQVIRGPVVLDAEPIMHREEETLFFLGAVLPDVFSSFDAEIHLYMGPETDRLEKIVITEPTVVRVPKGWWHGPLRFVRTDRPVLFQAALFSGDPAYVKTAAAPGGGELLVMRKGESHRFPFDDGMRSAPWTAVNEDGRDRYTDAGAYDPEKAPDGADCVIRPGYVSKPCTEGATRLLAQKPALTPRTAKCVLALPREVTQWGDWCPSPQTYFRGETYMEDAQYHIGWQIFTAANDMEEPHFHQGKEEYLFFMGADPMNMFDFDCEIEIMIGEDPDHMESCRIYRPCVVRFPANVWHCPIRFRKMRKPILFQAAFQDGTWGTITRSAAAGESAKAYFSRKYTYDYMGDNVRMCRYNDKKRCNVCGRCFPKQEIRE